MAHRPRPIDPFDLSLRAVGTRSLRRFLRALQARVSCFPITARNARAQIQYIRPMICEPCTVVGTIRHRGARSKSKNRLDAAGPRAQAHARTRRVPGWRYRPARFDLIRISPRPRRPDRFRALGFSETLVKISISARERSSVEFPPIPICDNDKDATLYNSI